MRKTSINAGFMALALLTTGAAVSVPTAGAFALPAVGTAGSSASSQRAQAVIMPGGVPKGMHLEMPDEATTVEQIPIVVPPAPEPAAEASAVTDGAAPADAAENAAEAADAAPAPAPAEAPVEPVVADVLAAEPSATVTPTPGEPVALDVVDSNGVAASEALATADTFQSVAATWPVGDDAPALQVRVRDADGNWSAWEPLIDDGAGPDAGQQPTVQLRAGSDTVFFGDAEAVQIATVGVGPEAVSGEDVSVALVGSPEPILVPDGVELSDAIGVPEEASAVNAAGIVDAGTGAGTGLGGGRSGSLSASCALSASGIFSTSSVIGAVNNFRDAAAQSTAAAGGVSTGLFFAVPPKIITRAEWGAKPPTATWPSAPAVEKVVLHHTAGSNNYSTQAQAMQQVRNDQSYHQNTRGWADIGYNFVIDKWGNIYEGAAGSIDSPVIGAHVAGFNTGSVGISMLGDYMSLNPPQELLDSVAQVAAWRLSAYDVEAQGSVTVTANSSNTKGWPAGKQVTVRTISAHRDLGSTDCPGNAGYKQMDAIRAKAESLQIDPGFLISDEVLYNSGSMTVEQVTEFLNTQGANCQPGEGTMCLKDYRETTVTRPATKYCAAAYEGAADEPAAQIISKAATACGVNPQFLLVTLQKEQSLITQPRSAETFAKAMGFRCPSSTPGSCEAEYAGFANQVYSAASRIRQYAMEPDNFPMKAGAWNTLPFGSPASCGSAKVLIRNQGTASLYNYTPYQPNPKGTPNCSPNGNLNFWRYFNQWFGNPLVGKVDIPLIPGGQTTAPTASPTVSPSPSPTSPTPTTTPTSPTPTTTPTASPTATEKQKFETVGSVSVAGTRSSGYTLTASVSGFKPEPAKYSYQWLRGNTAIKGATSSSYVVKVADAGKAISVRVTAKLNGYDDAQITSAVGDPVPPKFFSNGATKLSGTPAVGQTLTAKPTSFKPAPDRYEYVWLRNGNSIPEARSETYVLTEADLGQKISVQVTAYKAGYNNRLRTSAAVLVKPAATAPSSPASAAPATTATPTASAAPTPAATPTPTKS